MPWLTGRILGIPSLGRNLSRRVVYDLRRGSTPSLLSLSFSSSSLIILLRPRHSNLPYHRSITPLLLPRGLFLENGNRVRSLLPLAKRDLIDVYMHTGDVKKVGWIAGVEIARKINYSLLG